MIFVDTNVLLRYLTRSEDPRVQTMESEATLLFDQVLDGQETITTSEVVIHECAYVLMSSSHYGLDRETVAGYLGLIVNADGMRLPRGEKSLFLRALDLFATYPIEMADALVAARSERLGIPLATFDKQLAGLSAVEPWFDSRA